MKATLCVVDGELVARLSDERELKNSDAETLALLLWANDVHAGDLQAIDWHEDVMATPTSGQKIAIFSRLRKCENSDIEDRIQEGRDLTIRKLLVMPLWLSRAELTRSILERNENIEQIDLWITQRKIFAIEYSGTQHFAKFQFTETFEPREVISKILDILRSKDNWSLAAWFVFPNGWIPTLDSGAEQSAAPMHALDNVDAVLQAARNEKLGTYVA